MGLVFINISMLSSLIVMITSLLMFISAMFMWSVKYSIICCYELFYVCSSPMTFFFIVDPKGLLFSSVVLFISSNVLFYAKYYMEGDMAYNRFIYLVLAFVLSMNFLIFIPHFIAMLIGWDGLGLISYLLVIYYQNSKSLGAGMLTALINRLGDGFFLVAIGLVFNSNNWLITNLWMNWFPFLLLLLSLLACMTKSAQVPFSSWLPAAMAAPTPVSALVHSSTLVTAGIFLLIRFSLMFKMTVFNMIILTVGTITMFMSGLNALDEWDLKKIIALSTLSQLGLMMCSLGLGYVNLAYFHLLTHALFKSLLFLCAGNMIMINGHKQDLRSVSNMVYQLPITSSAFFLSSLSLMGAPFFSGFYSKDLILELSLMNPMSSFLLIMFFVSTGLTALYSLRLYFMLFLYPSNNSSLIKFDERGMMSYFPIVMLSVAAVMYGALLLWLLFPVDEVLSLNFNKKMFTVSLVCMMFLFMFLFSVKMFKMNTSKGNVNLFLESQAWMWFLLPLSSQMVLSHLYPYSKSLLKVVDQGWVEGCVSSVTGKSVTMIFNNLFLLQSFSINKLIGFMFFSFPMMWYIFM